MQQSSSRSLDDFGDLLTAEEVAALLRVTPAWVYAQTRRQRIPHLRLGRYVRYRRDALVLWMERLEAGSDALSTGGPAVGTRARPTSRRVSGEQPWPPIVLR